MKNVEILSAGTWNASTGKVKITSAMLDEIVSSFQTLNTKVTGFGIPLKRGHRTLPGDEALGWMSALQRIGNTLVADFEDVDPAIVDAIGKRRYNSVSVELRPKVEYADKTYTNVLSGVALLGTEWPAVKGLKPLSASLFSEDAEILELSEKEEDEMNFTQEQHDTLMAAAVAKAVSDAVADKDAKIEAAEKRATVAEAALTVFSGDAEKADVDAVIAAAEAKGQIVPANKPSIVAFAASVLKSVSKGDEHKALIASFKELVANLPKKVSFNEKTEQKKPVEGGAAAEKAADRVDAAVQAHMTAKGEKNYEVALAAVFKADPDLKSEYAQEM